MAITEEATTAVGDDAERTGYLTSVGKALAILDAFEGASSQLGVSEVARRASLPKSTAFRLLASLESQGYVERAGVSYRLGKRLFELGNQVSWCRPRNLRETALPYVCELYTATRKTVHLAVLDGADVLYIEKLQGKGQPETPTRVGARVSARTTALGKAMLAFADRDTLALALSRPPEPRTKYSIVLPEILLQELSEVRRVGFAFDREESRLGLNCVAAPVIHGAGPVGAISVSGATHDFDPQGIARRVRASADAVARNLT